MKTMKLITNCFTATLLFSTVINATANAAVVQTGCDPSKAKQSKLVTLRQSDQLLIANPGNSTAAGYEWLSEEGLRGVYNDMGRGQVVGSGGIYNFTVMANHLSDGDTLRFIYKRSFEATTISRCKIKIVIK